MDYYSPSPFPPAPCPVLSVLTSVRGPKKVNGLAGKDQKEKATDATTVPCQNILGFFLGGGGVEQRARLAGWLLSRQP